MTDLHLMMQPKMQISRISVTLICNFFPFPVYIFSHMLYNRLMNYLNLTKTDMETQEKLLSHYKSQLNHLPTGKLALKNIRGNLCYYASVGYVNKYAYCNDGRLIESLKTRRFLEKSIEIMGSNVSLQNRIVDKYRPYDYSSIAKTLSPAYAMTPACAMSTSSMAAPVSSSGDKLNHLTSFGLSVRSKSEAIIAELLFAEGIKFEYEKPLLLVTEDGSFITVYPDFTIEAWGRTIYWEHFGMFKDAAYRDSCFRKLTTYFFNGINCPENLIISMDSAEGNLDIMAIKMIINSLR